MPAGFGRPRKNADHIWHDFDAVADPASAPNLAYTLSEDGRRVLCTAQDWAVPAPNKRRKLSDLQGAHVGWDALEREDAPFDFPEWATGWAANGDNNASPDYTGEDEFVDIGMKRGRSTQVNPMDTWRHHSQQLYLAELLRGDGLRDALNNPHCTSCLAVYDQAYQPSPTAAAAAATSGAEPCDVDDSTATRTNRLLCCWECGDFNECLDCCLKRHLCMPLHIIESWTGAYWEKTTLATLGLVYQLGHGGYPCRHPEERVRRMVVIDQAIHTVHLRYCQCRLSDSATNVVQLLRNRWYPATAIDPETCATFSSLDFFRQAAVQANVNAHNYIKVLEHQTDALHLNWLADREKAFWRMARQYAFLMRLKRAGRGNVPGDIATTQPADLAVRCLACPRDGYNLPDNWEELKDNEKYRFQTILAVDANFRLKNRIRKNERSEAALGEGLGYFVDTVPYKEHVKGYVSEKDISSCIAFQALAEKDTKLTTGLRVSGVGGIICARHEIVQPHGLVDLQKGERYCNIDYALCSVINAIGPRSNIVVSYDIACQYHINFAERMSKLPPSLQVDLEEVEVVFGLPVWHGGIHEEPCRSRHSLKYRRVGRTDGEGIERVWSLLNPIAWATKEMGEGARHDWIEEKVDSQNFNKNIHQGETHVRRLVIALDERDIQVAAFKRVNSTVESRDQRRWKKAILEWDDTRQGSSPFTMPAKGSLSEADVRRQLEAEEMEAIKTGSVHIHGVSQTAFLIAGLQLEASQRRILADLKSPGIISMNLEGLINTRRRAFLTKLAKYRELQKVYMPGLAAYLESQASADTRALDAELIPLYLPSSIPANVRRMICAEGLPEKELLLRTAQASDGIDALRKKLHAKQYSIEQKNKHIVGQSKSTRARALLETLQEKLLLDAELYRAARAAVLSLRNVTVFDELPELRARDLQLEGEEAEPDADAMARSSRVGTAQRPRHIHVSTGKHQMSWIWTAQGAPSEIDEEEVAQTVRCLWAKAFARMCRWTEEVEMLREDMRRCLRSLEKEAELWRTRAETATAANPTHRSGIAAYALRRADQLLALKGCFQEEWNRPHGRSKRLVFERATALIDDQEYHLAESRRLLGLDDNGIDATTIDDDQTTQAPTDALGGQLRS
ncbi:hypothetical protein BD626DRAFT_573568 [Schizophyllum amplum]|uniref:CxC2-like cysteine cluster KDZ transposase-associated domain-containing protein n=1 Tax=Schizophyllum amplum TaxID=97359 RepID=A0A550C0R2_9AGAR|nr:hypothetical protein BD626DRAFT_573568 [Auriculariopsis ampla]